MYGLVNKAIHNMVVEKFGEPSWNKIKEKAGLDIDLFLSMESYDDAVTYQLVGAGSEVLDIPAYDILVEFGKYWVEFTAEQGYGDMLKMAGNNFVEFLTNLDNMHAGIGYTYPNLRPPSFTCEVIDNENLILQYRSEREGLAPLVVGLLYGLGKRFNLDLKIDHVKNREQCAYDEFLVQHSTIQNKVTYIESINESV